MGACACAEMKNIGKPCAGEPHARYDGGVGENLLATLPYLRVLKQAEMLADGLASESS
jgi:hypothetical protein